MAASFSNSSKDLENAAAGATRQFGNNDTSSSSSFAVVVVVVETVGLKSNSKASLDVETSTKFVPNRALSN